MDKYKEWSKAFWNKDMRIGRKAYLLEGREDRQKQIWIEVYKTTKP